MATREIAATPIPSQNMVAAATPNYSRPLAIVTTLFFMWGFLTCLNDILGATPEVDL
jgi:FHS family L-fucose permease-like MFS transporter